MLFDATSLQNVNTAPSTRDEQSAIGTQRKLRSAQRERNCTRKKLETLAELHELHLSEMITWIR